MDNNENGLFKSCHQTKLTTSAEENSKLFISTGKPPCIADFGKDHN